MASREVEAVLEAVQVAGLARAVEADAVASQLGIEPGPTLRELAAAAPDGWGAILTDHRNAFIALTEEIQAGRRHARLILGGRRLVVRCIRVEVAPLSVPKPGEERQDRLASSASVRRVALASCSLWPTGSGDHAGLVEALADRGVRAEWVPWDDPGANWAGYDLALLRETWDYPPKLARFLDWVDWLSTVTAVANPAAVVRWNHHKRYLQALASAGVPTVSTTLVTAADPDPEAALRGEGAGMMVVKPAVGIGGDDAVRGGADDPAMAEHLRALLAGGDVLVQPYLRGIETSGETSLVPLGGRLSHAVGKRPTAGEFRIHEHRGGTYRQVNPSFEQVEVAQAACEAARGLTGSALVYARVDLVAGDDGRPLVMEVELIEPSLYLHVVPAATSTLADVVIEKLAG